jgi:membrane protease subunit HflK
MDMNTQNLNLAQNLKKIGKYWQIIAGILFVVAALWSSIFQISTEEVGVITRFGKYVRQVESGLNLKIPFAEEVYKVPVERQQKLEFGFRTTQAGVNTQYSQSIRTREESLSTEDESLMLTGDLNLAEVQWVVQYRIDNAYNNLFKVRNPESTLRTLSEAAMRQIVGDRTVNEVLTVGRTEIANNLQQLIQQICREYSLGLKIEQVVLQDVNPPEPVKAAFNAVNEAQQEKETLINQAKSEYNKVIPKARGQAEETIQQAEGYAAERVNNADGEAARFTALYNEFIKAPEVTKRRIYLETMSTVMPKIGNVVITDQKGNNVLPLLQMQMNKGTETKNTNSNEN